MRSAGARVFARSVKMRVIYLLCACSALAQNNYSKYDARYDSLDIDAILDSKRLVRNYVDCLVNVKPCTAEGKALKRILPEALRTKCVRCTERQKKYAVKVIKRLKSEYPQDWAKLSMRWDPTGDFTRYFEDYLAKELFNTIPNDGNEIGSASTLPTRAPPRIFTSATQPSELTTTPRPAILNRFGEDGEETMVGSESSDSSRPHHKPASTTKRPLTSKTLYTSVKQPKPTQTTWARPVQTTWPKPLQTTWPKPLQTTWPKPLQTTWPKPSQSTWAKPSQSTWPKPSQSTWPRPSESTWPKPSQSTKAKPSQSTWPSAAPAASSHKHTYHRPTDLPLAYTTAITLIDQISYKIIRTTELFSDIFKNTLRAVAG